MSPGRDHTRLSAGDLYVMSGKRTQRVDRVIVFVVFSVADGTDSGIFYD